MIAAGQLWVIRKSSWLDRDCCKNVLCSFCKKTRIELIQESWCYLIFRTKRTLILNLCFLEYKKQITVSMLIFSSFKKYVQSLKIGELSFPGFYICLLISSLWTRPVPFFALSCFIASLINIMIYSVCAIFYRCSSSRLYHFLTT